MSVKEEKGKIEVFGARVHNLKNIDAEIPHNSLTVITGLSGSGKSSLAFDTIFAEGQRRYLETFSTYARNFLGGMERPDVDKITGLSPVISIEQKTTNKNPRSTVGTTTEIYDYMRLLFSRAGEAYSYLSGEKMVKYSEEQILQLLLDAYAGKRIYMLAPLVKGRKGHYKELFEQMMHKGYLNVRIDGEMCELSRGLMVERYKNHDIEVVIDKLVVDAKDTDRLKQSLATTLQQGDGLVMIMEMPSGSVRYFSKRLMCPTTGLSYKEPDPHNFSFNSPQGFCPKCKGLGVVSAVDVEKVVPDRSLSVYDGALAPLGKYRRSSIFQQLEAVLARYDATLKTPVEELPDEAIDEILYGSPVPLTYGEGTDMYYDSITTYDGLVKYIQLQKETSTSAKELRWAEQFSVMQPCPECGGARLNKEALHYLINGKNIHELATMDIALLHEWFNNLGPALNEKQRAIATEIVKEIQSRIGFLLDVGLGYLSLNRSSASLSGGEGQRIRLATQVGSRLVNVLYILDEPSIGLHPRDNDRLINSLKALRDSGNTVVVVEHDRDIMLASDYIIDMGPKAGRKGGEVVFAGTPQAMLAADTMTARFLEGKERIEIPATRRPGNGKSLKIFGACGNNLKNVDVEFPLGKLICVTGVSGGGKSSLVNDTLQPVLMKHFYNALREPLPYDRIEGIENVDKVVAVDQSPLGRTPRSNAATYTGVFADIRNLFVELPEAKIRGYKAGRFSFNVSGGRCDACSGNGYKTLEMNFLPDVMVPCEVCRGKRYNRETLEVRYKGKSIADVLDMTINVAVEFFENVPTILNKIKVLQDVGLGYIKLGQPSTTLSGGESQRVKLATELSKRDTGKTIYLLDEPTTGLHFEDIRVLMDVINRLVDKGNTVVIIEHNLDVIKMADHIIDMGPEGGRDGGMIMATGTPEEVAACGKGRTAPYLAAELGIK